MKKIIIGTRGSKLSLAYAAKVKKLMLNNSIELSNKIEIKTIKTSGDLNQNVKLSQIGGKNLFCKEIEEDLLKKNIDIAIHSLKDMETAEHDELMIGAYIERSDPRDVIISNKINSIDELQNGLIIGSSSRRRELQLKNISKKITVADIRGNVDTRIEKLKSGEIDAVILALAGLKSLNLEKKITFIFDSNQILSAAGQGIIAVQCRKKDKLIINYLKKINHIDTSKCAIAERSMLKALGGDCDTAVGGLAEIKGNDLFLRAQLFSDKGDENFNFSMTGSKDNAFDIGKKVGTKLLTLAGSKFKKK
tara:strand:+ start:881 stop:1798 length:918 start_codon:yes stop_codon:yes gene_type:complete